MQALLSAIRIAVSLFRAAVANPSVLPTQTDRLMIDSYTSENLDVVHHLVPSQSSRCQPSSYRSHTSTQQLAQNITTSYQHSSSPVDSQ